VFSQEVEVVEDERGIFDEVPRMKRARKSEVVNALGRLIHRVHLNVERFSREVEVVKNPVKNERGLFDEVRG
jgi:hypothetical protein